MDAFDYEEVIRRRKARRQAERARRRRKVSIIYALLIVAVIAVSAAGYMFFSGRSRQAGAGPQGGDSRQTGGGPLGEGGAQLPEGQPGDEDETAGGSQPAEGDPSGNAGQPAGGGQPAEGDPSGNAGQPAEGGQPGGGQTGEEQPGKAGQAAGEGQAAGDGRSQGIFGRFVAWIKGLLKGIFPPKENEPASVQEDPSTGESSVSGEGQADPATIFIQKEEGAAQTGRDSHVVDMSTPEGRLAGLLAAADELAAGYDYDGAIALLQADEEFSGGEEVAAAIAGYETTRAGLVEQDISKISHVFFHSLVIDTSKAFDGDEDQKGYNQVMTTKSEFEKILQEMYDRGYVLVRLHDMAHEEADENGQMKMVRGKIMLPEGKKAFVMSQDDVCYYPYMDGDGFASRIVIGEDGKPTCEMKLEDGTVVTGEYDLVPILEAFIQEHPDFSYKGARAVLAFTGYEGILGYRTAASYQGENPNYEADRAQAAQVAQCLRDNGWELASHSWGHRYLGQIDLEDLKKDTDKWEAEVESLIGPTDIILFPFGDDIADWHSYTQDNARYAYLYGVGFRYFCNVDSSQAWVQLGEDYLRQGRFNLDGYRMWQDIVANQEGGSGKRVLGDFFNAEDVFDPARPTPVEWD